MGRGIALQFKKQFPENFRAYSEACDRGDVRPGRMFVFETRALTNPHYIINFPTKRHWRGNSGIDDIEAGLSALAQVIRERGIRSIAIPALGSGLGGLKWSVVRSRIQEAPSAFDNLEAIVFTPTMTPVQDRIERSSEIETRNCAGVSATPYRSCQRGSDCAARSDSGLQADLVRTSVGEARGLSTFI